MSYTIEEINSLLIQNRERYKIGLNIHNSESEMIRQSKYFEEQNINNDKTICSVYCDSTYGIGDFLRGSIQLAQYAKYYKIKFKIDITNHNISKYVDIVDNVNVYSRDKKIYVLSTNENINVLHSLLKNFLNSNDSIIYIISTSFYNITLVTPDIKEYINYAFTFKQKFYDKVNKLITFNNTKVLHIRCTDENFSTNFNDSQLINKIRSMDLPRDTIIISNNYSIKLKLNGLFGFQFINEKSTHIANAKNVNGEFDSTIIEYIILSKSSHTYCISYYEHGSGFSEQCSMLNNVPYNLYIIKPIIRQRFNMLNKNFR